MTFNTDDKVLKSNTPQKVRIGSRVPNENRDWLQRHGIVTDGLLSEKETPQRFFSPLLFQFTFFLLGTAICLMVWLVFQQYHDWNRAVQQETLRVQSLEASNYHLRENLEKQIELGKVQQFEINRLAFEIENIKWNLGQKIRSLEKRVEIETALGVARDVADSKQIS